MIFFGLNIALFAFLVFQTVYVDRMESRRNASTSPVIANILLFSVTVALFSLLIFVRNIIKPELFSVLMRILFVFEGCLLVNLSFCFTYNAWHYISTPSIILKLFLYAVVGWIALFKIGTVTLSLKIGVFVSPTYVFSESVRSVFPLTWKDLFDILVMYLFPTCGCIAMLVKNEISSNNLEKFKGILYAASLLTIWALSFALEIICKQSRCFNLLHYFMYLPTMIIMPISDKILAVPSGRSLTSFSVKSLFLYLLPAVAMGFVFKLLYPLESHYKEIFLLAGFLSAGLILWFVTTVSKLISKSKFGHSGDYAAKFEKDLASIDYNGEMDEIADSMYQIFKKNVESSFLSVYINGGNNTFEEAYSSKSKHKKITDEDGLFEALLNIDKNVLIYSEIDNSHVLSNIKDKLEKFFDYTDADALFILNEGRTVHGFIILGIKTNKDHYKEYDLNIFNKLFSYFFVFGYYMRNISNKEIIGTVNRELRMSSQIITSIQENMDAISSHKIDAGCIMVPAHNIGGEFVDMIRLTDTRHMFVVGDLSGKGIAASMNMVILKSIIRAYLAEIHDFKQLVVKVNSFIKNNLEKGTIFSGVFAILNFENDTMYYINCGIPSMLLYTQSYNNVIEIQGEGHILGFVEDISPYIGVKQIEFHQNDIVLACTNGLIESHSLRGEEFGKDRIQHNMVSNSMYPAQRMAQFQYDELVRFMSHEMEDDVSVLVIKYLHTNESEKAEAEAIKADFYKQVYSDLENERKKSLAEPELNAGEVYDAEDVKSIDDVGEIESLPEQNGEKIEGDIEGGSEETEENFDTNSVLNEISEEKLKNEARAMEDDFFSTDLSKVDFGNIDFN